MDEASLTLTQKRLLGGSQTLTLDGDILRVQRKQGLSLQEYRFDLRGFVPDVMRFRHVPLARIIGFTMAGLFGGFLIPFAIIAETRPTMPEGISCLGLLGIILAAVAIGGWISTAKQLVDVLVIEGPGGRMILWPDRPDKERFSQFLAVLIARIRNAQSHERTILHRLRQAGIINDWQYDQAMELLHGTGDANE